MFKNLIKTIAVAGLMSLPMAANAVTVSATDANGNVLDPTNISITGTGVLSTVFVNITALGADIGTMLNEVISIANNTTVDFFVAAVTDNPDGVVSNLQTIVTGPGVPDAPVAIVDGAGAHVVKVLAGTTADFTLTGDIVGVGNVDLTVSAIPLPAGGLLLLTALGGLGIARRKKKAA